MCRNYCLLVEATEILGLSVPTAKLTTQRWILAWTGGAAPTELPWKCREAWSTWWRVEGRWLEGGGAWTQGGPRELCAFSVFHVVHNNLEKYPRSMWVQRTRLPANLTTQFLFNKCQMQLSITADFYIGNVFLRWLFSYTWESSSFISSLYLCRLPNDADGLFHFYIPNSSYPLRTRSNVIIFDKTPFSLPGWKEKVSLLEL